MNMFFVLAETTRSAHQQIVSMDMFWEQVAKLSWLQALIAVSFGAVYLIYKDRKVDYSEDKRLLS